VPRVFGNVLATTIWDPDGAGPQPAVLVVGGLFSVGSIISTNVAAFDGERWSRLGTPPGTLVSALTVFNGRLVAAFWGVGGELEGAVHAFDGTSWQPFGGTFSNFIHALAVYNGELIVGGNFATAGGVPCSRIARWNGASWSPLGLGVAAPGTVLALAVFLNGGLQSVLYVGGAFSTAGGAAVRNLATWNGSSWSQAGEPNGIVRSLAVRNAISIFNSFLFAGGEFTTFVGAAAQHVARYDPSANSWQALGGGLSAPCTALFVRGIGISSYEVTAGVDDPASTLKVWRLSGSMWSSLGTITGSFLGTRPRTFAFFNFGLLVGLEPPAFGQEFALRSFDGTEWQTALGRGMEGNVLAVLADGDAAIIGGALTTIAGVAVNGIARGSSQAWQAMGDGMSGGTATVHALARLRNGDVVAGGDFATAGGAAAANIARWNGTAWTPLGGGMDGPVLALAVLPNGELVAGGMFTAAGGIAAGHIARWNGSVWAPFGGGTNGAVRALAPLANGDVIAGGSFTVAGGVSASHVARWTLGGWAPLGSGLSALVFALAALPNGDVMAGGDFPDGLLRWDGQSWRHASLPLVNRPIHALLTLQDGSLAVGGASVLQSSGLVRLQAGEPRSLSAFGPVRALARTFAGDLLAGGTFDRVGQVVSARFARLVPPCPADSVAYGAGCSGSAGPLTLAATERPWLGGSYRATTSRMAPGALALEVLGLASTSIPLSSIHPAGGAGCNLLATPDVTMFLPVANGVATSIIPLPRDAALIGSMLYDQVLQIELGDAGIRSLTSSNGLRLTFGVF
jgi:hypothetical protein